VVGHRHWQYDELWVTRSQYVCLIDLAGGGRGVGGGACGNAGGRGAGDRCQVGQGPRYGRSSAQSQPHLGQ